MCFQVLFACLYLWCYHAKLTGSDEAGTVYLSRLLWNQALVTEMLNIFSSVVFLMAVFVFVVLHVKSVSITLNFLEFIISNSSPKMAVQEKVCF